MSSAWGLSWWRTWANAWGSVLVQVQLPDVDRFDWTQPRRAPATALPMMRRASQQQWLQRMRRRR